MSIKSTFSFNESADRTLNNLAERLNVSKSEVLRRAVTLYEYLESAKDGQGHVRIESPTGDKVDLLLP